MIKARHKTRPVKIGDICIGGNNPIAIQSMTKTKTCDIENTVKQIKELQGLGCEIVRLAVKDSGDSKAIKKIKQKVNLPIVADIHFNWRLAQEAIDSGADKIRLNPGNIYKKNEIREIVSAAKLNRIPIRIGVNSGSLRKAHLATGISQVDAMVESALDYIKILEGFGLYDIVVSLKASDILDTIQAYRKVSKVCDYPLHLGVTATGLAYNGAIKSSIALGVLLLEGIGDTIRVSLTDQPQQEVNVAKIILKSLGLEGRGLEIVSCPTCGRCEVDLVKLVKELENKVSHKVFGRLVKLAVMGCVVNGPGEAKDADIGIAFGRKEGLLFRRGEAIKKLSFSNCMAGILEELEAFYD